MAVVENADSTNRGDSVVQNSGDHSNGDPTFWSNDQTGFVKNQQQQSNKVAAHRTNGDGAQQMSLVELQKGHSVNGNGGAHQMMRNNNGVGVDVRRNGGDDDGESYKQEMRDLEEMLSKLNPMAEEFVPPSLVINYKPVVQPIVPGGAHFGYVVADNNFVMQVNSPVANGNSTRRKKNGYGHAKRRMNSRTSMAQREEIIRRTVYVCDIDQQVTEEQLAALFITCGQVVDCRVCGDPNSVLRFAFVEFMDEEGARNALGLAGTMLGFYPVRVLPSKTAIAPVNPTFLPRSEDEREMCSRTIYCTNIDKKVTQADVKLFFEHFCGEVYRLRLLGDYHHSTRIAFVEFVMAESAIAALNCSGAVMGSLPIRVSPSKTPVRPRAPRPTMQ
ncbi:hypothetical protein ACET3Z_014921 [Daucus carota]